MTQPADAPVAKRFVSADQLVADSFTLADRIYRSGYRPEVILVLWRGGTPVGVVIHEYLLYRGIETWHTAIKAQSYVGINARTAPRIEHLDTVLADIAPGRRVLVIDDIFDSGCTLECVLAALAPITDCVRTATLYVKRGQRQGRLAGPDYFLHTTDEWIVFPHEIVGLAPGEIAGKSAALAALLAAP